MIIGIFLKILKIDTYLDIVMTKFNVAVFFLFNVILNNCAIKRTYKSNNECSLFSKKNEV